MHIGSCYPHIHIYIIIPIIYAKCPSGETRGDTMIDGPEIRPSNPRRELPYPRSKHVITYILYSTTVLFILGLGIF